MSLFFSPHRGQQRTPAAAQTMFASPAVPASQRPLQRPLDVQYHFNGGGGGASVSRAEAKELTDTVASLKQEARALASTRRQGFVHTLRAQNAALTRELLEVKDKAQRAADLQRTWEGRMAEGEAGVERLRQDYAAEVADLRRQLAAARSEAQAEAAKREQARALVLRAVLSLPLSLPLSPPHASPASLPG